MGLHRVLGVSCLPAECLKIRKLQIQIQMLASLENEKEDLGTVFSYSLVTAISYSGWDSQTLGGRVAHPPLGVPGNNHLTTEPLYGPSVFKAFPR